MTTKVNLLNQISGTTDDLTEGTVNLFLSQSDQDKIDNLPNNTQSELNNKVDKVVGKGLSTEDYTTTEKNKLAGIEAGAEVNKVNEAPIDGKQYARKDGDWSEVVGLTGAVDSVNGQTGIVVLDADDISDTTTTNKFTNATDISRLANTSGTNTGDETETSILTKLPAIADTNSFRGFIDNYNITVTGNLDRTVTLTHPTALKYAWKGKETSLGTSWTSSAHGTDTSKRYFLYSTDGVNFTWSETVWDFEDLMITLAFYDTTLASWIYLREVHGAGQNPDTHRTDHLNIGTYRVSGGAPTDGTYAIDTSTDVSLTPGFDEALVYDEDLPSIIPAWTEGTYTTGYTNSSNVMVFDTTKTFPFHFTTSGYINYFNNGVETQGQTGRFYNVYQILIPTASDTNSQKFRTILLQPQTQHTSLATAQAEDFRSLNLGNFTNLSPESVGYTRLTYGTNSSYPTTGKVRLVGISYLAGSRASQVSVSGYVPTDHNTLTGLQGGIAGEYYHLTTTQLEKIENGVMITDGDANTVTTGGRYGMIGTPTNGAIAGEFYLEVLSDGTRIMQVATYLNGQVYTRYYDSTWSSWVNADGLVGTKEVDETDIANGKILVYNSTSGKLEYETPSAGGSGGNIVFQDYGGQAVIGILGTFDAETTGTLVEATLICDTLPVGSNLICELRKNSTTTGNVLNATLQVTTTESATNGRYKGTPVTSFTSTSIADGDVFYCVLTSVGSTTSATNARLILRYS